MNIKLKKALCIASLSSICVTFNSSCYKNNSKQLIKEYYNVNIEDTSEIENSFYNITNGKILFDPEKTMVPQGLTIKDEYLLISSYDYCGNKKSTITTIDNNGNVINTCKLDIKAHVGGIAYDEEHNLLWVSNVLGTVNAYDIDKVITCEKVYPIYSDLELGKDLINYKNEPAVSYLAYHNNKLYVGNYTSDEQGTMKEYNIEINDKKLEYKLNKKYTVPTYVQGVTFYETKENKYIIFSRSRGTTPPSLLQIFPFEGYEFKENDNKAINYETPKMMEQIIIEEEKLYTLYESSAYPYKYATSGGTDSIYISDINLILKK